MKRYCPLLLAMLWAGLMAPQAQAQVQRVSFGIKGGVDLADLDYELSSSYDPATLGENKARAGQIQGIFAGFDLGRVSIQPELLFSRRGAKWEYTDTEGATY